jgi:hypothetical protein
LPKWFRAKEYENGPEKDAILSWKSLEEAWELAARKRWRRGARWPHLSSPWSELLHVCF